MASPQTENGYTRISNELLEEICKYSFTSVQMAVILTIIRHSYGWRKTWCDLSGEMIASETGIAKQHICAAIKTLAEKCVITVSEYGKAKSRRFELNKDYDKWNVTKRVTSKSRNPLLQSNGIGYFNVTESVTSTIKRKDKERERKHSPDFLTLWELYPAERRDGLEWIPAECEREILENEHRFRSALESYLDSTPAQYIVKAEKFFSEKWKAYAPEEEPKKKRGNLQ